MKDFFKSTTQVGAANEIKKLRLMIERHQRVLKNTGSYVTNEEHLEKLIHKRDTIIKIYPQLKTDADYDSSS